MFSFEFCEISKNKFFTEHLWLTASLFWQSILDQKVQEYDKYTMSRKMFAFACNFRLFGIKN